MDLIDIFRTFHPNAEEYTFFSSAHGTFSRIDHILGYKSNLGNFKKTEIVSSIFSDHSAMRLDINYKEKTVRNTNTWRLNDTFLNNQQVSEGIKRVIPVQQPQALVSSIQPGLAICFTLDNIHISMLFSQIIPPGLIHVKEWQKPLQYCKVISLQLIKINEKK